MYKIVEIVKSKAIYKGDIMYLINPDRKQDSLSFSQAIGDSAIVDQLEQNETSVDADIIVAFRDIP